MHELVNRTLEELRHAWRFRWYGALVAWALCVLGWLVVYSLPNVYKVQARVRIDTTSVIQPLIEDLTVSPGADWQVDLLIHTVLSTPNLKEIARRTGLAIQAITPVAEERMLAELDSRIEIINEHNSINLYSISYTGDKPGKARDIVQEVINIMTGMALGNGVQESERAIAFLGRKVDSYRSQLHAIEAKVAEFRKAHPELVEGRGGYLARLQTTRAVGAQMELSLETLQNKHESLQAQLGELAGRGFAIPPDQSPDVQSLDARIDQVQAELTQMATRYTPRHPDIIRHQAILERLHKQRQELVAQLRANPRRVSGRNTAQYREVQQRVNELEIEIETLRSGIAQKNLEAEVLASNSGEATDAQSQLADLGRNYETIKGQYELLLERLNAARLSRDMDSFGDPLDFRIVDPPEIPDIASGPPRILFMAVVLLAGLGGGAGFAFFLSQLRPVFMTRRKLTQVTGLPVLGAVSMAFSARHRAQRRTSLAVFGLAIGGLVAGFVVAVVLMPYGVRTASALLELQWL